MPRAVVHVVGTNGKGSVAARIDAGLRSVGQRTVRFTSPHVESITERITVDGSPLDADRIVDFVAHARRSGRTHEGAFFEWMLALALETAHDHRADVLVLEAGVGAASDATIVVEPVVASVVTTVADDHLDTIGPTVEDVARDKAAALRRGVPAVTGADGAPLEIVRSVARERDVALTIVDPVTSPDVTNHAGGDADDDGARPHGRMRPVDAFTARLAVATLEALGIDDPAAFRAARRPTGLPARRERFSLPGGVDVLLDGAHNVQAMSALMDEVPPGAVVLLGVAARKRALDVADVVQRRRPRRVVLTNVAPDDTPWPPGSDHVADPLEALDVAMADVRSGLGPPTLLVTGSFYLAGQIRPVLRSWSTDPRDGDPRHTDSRP